jgi:hypothetical protein
VDGDALSLVGDDVTIPSIGHRGVKLAAIGLWNSGNTFSGVIYYLHHLAVRQKTLGLADARRMQWSGAVFHGSGPLVPAKGNLNARAKGGYFEESKIFGIC